MTLEERKEIQQWIDIIHKNLARVHRNIDCLESLMNEKEYNEDSKTDDQNNSTSAKDDFLTKY